MCVCVCACVRVRVVCACVRVCVRARACHLKPRALWSLYSLNVVFFMVIERLLICHYLFKNAIVPFLILKV